MGAVNLLKIQPGFERVHLGVVTISTIQCGGSGAVGSNSDGGGGGAWSSVSSGLTGLGDVFLDITIGDGTSILADGKDSIVQITNGSILCRAKGGGTNGTVYTGGQSSGGVGDVLNSGGLGGRAGAGKIGGGGGGATSSGNGPNAIADIGGGNIADGTLAANTGIGANANGKGSYGPTARQISAGEKGGGGGGAGAGGSYGTGGGGYVLVCYDYASTYPSFLDLNRGLPELVPNPIRLAAYIPPPSGTTTPSPYPSFLELNRLNDPAPTPMPTIPTTRPIGIGIFRRFR